MSACRCRGALKRPVRLNQLDPNSPQCGGPPGRSVTQLFRISLLLVFVPGCFACYDYMTGYEVHGELRDCLDGSIAGAQVSLTLNDAQGVVVLQSGLRTDESGLVTDKQGRFSGFVEGFRGECALTLVRLIYSASWPVDAPLPDGPVLVVHLAASNQDVTVEITEEMITRDLVTQGGVFDRLDLGTVCVERLEE